MKIEKKVENGSLVVSVEGRLDTSTAPTLEGELANLSDTTNLVLDMQNLEYISSAGLRVILKLQKLLGKKGSLTLKNVCASIMEVFDITGFSDFLTIE